MENRKSNLRTLMIELRNSLSLNRRKEASIKLLKAFSEIEGFLLSYDSFNGELETKELNAKLASFKKLVLPKIEGKTLGLYLVSSIKNDLEQNSLGFFEPIPNRCQKIPLDQIAMILVPGLCFDASHHRLGYGKGYYDRLLRGRTFSTIGVGFLEQFTTAPLPISSEDVPLSQLALF